jgi:hypothetical protein
MAIWVRVGVPDGRSRLSNTPTEELNLLSSLFKVTS